MSTRIFVMAILTVGVFATSSFAATPGNRPRGINAREHRQAARIRDGVQDGELTKAELDKLRADEAAVRAEERVYRRSGDGLNRQEVRDLEHDVNQTSHEIYRAKHN